MLTFVEGANIMGLSAEADRRKINIKVQKKFLPYGRSLSYKRMRKSTKEEIYIRKRSNIRFLMLLLWKQSTDESLLKGNQGENNG